MLLELMSIKKQNGCFVQEGMLVHLSFLKMLFVKEMNSTKV